MKSQRRFSREFKHQVVEELLSEVNTPAQLMCSHEISSGLLYHWRRHYAKGEFDNPPDKESALEECVRQLEQLAGKLSLEREFSIVGLAKQLQGMSYLNRAFCLSQTVPHL